MDNNLIQQARNLCSEATDPPWELYDTPNYTEIHVQGGKEAGFSPVALADEKHNAAFIAASRTLVLQLCDALEKSQKDMATLRNELCLKCGKYHNAHLGACDECRWKI